MKVRGGHSEPRDIRAYVVARQQDAVTIERGVLHRLGRQRRAQLLEAGDRDAARLVVEIAYRLATKPAIQQTDDRTIGRAAISHRPGHRLRERGVIGRGPPPASVAPIDREMCQQRNQHTADGGKRRVARFQPHPGDAMQRGSRRVDLRCEAAIQHLAASGGLLGGEIRRAAAHRGPKFPQRRLAGRIVQQRIHIIHEVVAAGAVHAPVGRQALAGAQYLLDDQPGAATEPLPQPPAIAGRIRQAIDMIHPHAVDQTFSIETEQRRVRCLEHRIVLDPERDKAVDVEEAPPVDLVAGRAPPGKPIVLALQQSVQARPARFRHRIVRIRRGRRDLGMIRGTDRKDIVEVADDRRAIVVTRQGDRAGSQSVPVGLAEERRQYLPVQGRIGAVPVDVEEAGKAARLAMLQDIAPPGVLDAAGCHVVRHDIDDDAKARTAQSRDQGPQTRLAAQFRVHPRRVHYVVAVHRPWPRGKDRRRVQMADPQ